MALHDSQIVNVDLSPILFEFVQLVCGKAADDLLATHGDDSNEMLFAQQPSQIIITRNGALVGLDLAESLSENSQQVFEEGYIRGRELPIRIGERVCHSVIPLRQTRCAVLQSRPPLC
jgi:hypothetical protein